MVVGFEMVVLTVRLEKTSVQPVVEWTEGSYLVSSVIVSSNTFEVKRSPMSTTGGINGIVNLPSSILNLWPWQGSVQFFFIFF